MARRFRFFTAIPGSTCVLIVLLIAISASRSWPARDSKPDPANRAPQSQMAMPPRRPGAPIPQLHLPCNCSRHGDINDDGLINALDAVLFLNHVIKHRGPAPIADPRCPAINRGDLNCDDRVNAADVSALIAFVYQDGPRPCDPCSR